ncbi:uncharacterized protein LOC126153215 [Schistocerca cancellata]|uniref:uncharacterized protein LOC126153215 n=1 Tax=Schistocerca cancellata TaxID=274614 RepID=UPI00211769DC|nr:uncharacterized protein LOC126153215 [Schistocerca cancellata]
MYSQYVTFEEVQFRCGWARAATSCSPAVAPRRRTAASTRPTFRPATPPTPPASTPSARDRTNVSEWCSKKCPYKEVISAAWRARTGCRCLTVRAPCRRPSRCCATRPPSWRCCPQGAASSWSWWRAPGGPGRASAPPTTSRTTLTTTP